MQHFWLLSFVVCTLTLLASGCLYQAPDDDYLQEIPTTNNPTITRSSTTQLGMPV